MSGLQDSNSSDSYDNALFGLMGGTDNTRIGNNGNKLLVDATFSAPPNIMPSMTGFKADYYSTNFALTTSYQTLFSNSGSGHLMGFRLKGSAEPYAVKLMIDGVVSFDVERADIDSMDLEEWTYTGLQRYFGMSTAAGFEFFPTIPIQYSSSFDISVKRTVSWTFNITNRIFMYTE